jgi:hypothetical protein
MVSAGLEASLERFGDAALLAAGKVNLISVEAVQTRLGARWPQRQEQVYDFTARVLERALSAGDLSLRVSETDFLVVQTELGRLAGQALCTRCLREILNHFLGDDHLAGEGVMQVDQIAGDHIVASPADPRSRELEPSRNSPPEQERGFTAGPQLIGVDAAPDTGAGPAMVIPGEGLEDRLRAAFLTGDEPPRAPAAPAPVSVIAPWSPFVAHDGRQLRISATLEPVYELRRFTRIGFRMIRRVVVTRTREDLTPRAIAQLSASDLLRVDLATIARGIDRLKQHTGEEQLSLVIPLSYPSLASRRGRMELVQPLRAAGGLVSCGVICEICDLDGVPPGALLSAVSLIRPFTLHVVGQLQAPTSPGVSLMKDTGLRGFSFEAPHRLGDAEFAAWATAAIQAAKRVTSTVLVYGISTVEQAASVATAGATHVSLRRAPQALRART